MIRKFRNFLSIIWLPLVVAAEESNYIKSSLSNEFFCLYDEDYRMIECLHPNKTNTFINYTQAINEDISEASQTLVAFSLCRQLDSQFKCHGALMNCLEVKVYNVSKEFCLPGDKYIPVREIIIEPPINCDQNHLSQHQVLDNSNVGLKTQRTSRTIIIVGGVVAGFLTIVFIVAVWAVIARKDGRKFRNSTLMNVFGRKAR